MIYGFFKSHCCKNILEPISKVIIANEVKPVRPVHPGGQSKQLQIASCLSKTFFFKFLFLKTTFEKGSSCLFSGKTKEWQSVRTSKRNLYISG